MAAEPDKKQRIIAAAERLFTNRRFHELTLDEVAQEAHVGKGTIYRYFEDKDDLFFQLATSGFDELCELVEQYTERAGPFEERLEQMCEEVSQFFRQRRQMFQIIQAEGAWIAGGNTELYQRWLKRRTLLRVAVTRILEQGVREGVLRADIPADVLATYLLGMLRTRARDLENAPKKLRALTVMLGLFMKGAGAAGEAPE